MNANFKRTKHGQLPGDLPKAIKIRMRECKEPIEVYYGPGHSQIINTNCIKKFRKDLAKRGNRRFRHKPITLE